MNAKMFYLFSTFIITKDPLAFSPEHILAHSLPFGLDKGSRRQRWNWNAVPSKDCKRFPTAQNYCVLHYKLSQTILDFVRKKVSSTVYADAILARCSRDSYGHLFLQNTQHYNIFRALQLSTVT